MQDGERNVLLHLEVRGSKFKVITNKVTVIVTDSWWGPFWLCQCSSSFWHPPGRSTGPIQMKSSRTFIPGNNGCIERITIWKKNVFFTILLKLCKFYFCVAEISAKKAMMSKLPPYKKLPHLQYLVINTNHFDLHNTKIISSWVSNMVRVSGHGHVNTSRSHNLVIGGTPARPEVHLHVRRYTCTSSSVDKNLNLNLIHSYWQQCYCNLVAAGELYCLVTTLVLNFASSVVKGALILVKAITPLSHPRQK